MPTEQQVTRARLIEWEHGAAKPGGKTVEVQFNPETLKVSRSFSQPTGGETTKGTAQKSPGSSTLQVDLWFDTSALDPYDRNVLNLTRDVVYFVTPLAPKKDGQWTTPYARFLWGSFLFDGRVTSLQESLEFFEHEGTPLRARISLTMAYEWPE